MTFTDLSLAMAREIQNMKPADIRQEAVTSGTRINKFGRAVQVYNRAQQTSKKYGLIGVGSISFANNRLATFCRRANLEL